MEIPKSKYKWYLLFQNKTFGIQTQGFGYDGVIAIYPLS